MRESSQFGIPEMANQLEVRKNNHQKILLLGARTGRLFRSSHFYELLRPFSKRNFHQLSRIEQFQECYSILTGDNKFSERDLHSILQASLKTLLVSDADANLASLIKDELFDEIITTNIDDALEDTLSQIGTKEGWDYEVVRIGHHAYYSDHKTTHYRIIKPFGDLMSRDYIIRERGAHLENPRLKSFLQHLLQQDTVILGLDPTWDCDILQLIPTQANSALWFVSEEEDIAEKSTVLHNLLSTRNAFQLLGHEGNYDHFLQGLHHYLNRSLPTSYQVVPDLQRLFDQIDVLTNLLSVRSVAYTNIVQPIDQPASIAEKSPLHADVLLVTVTEIETQAVLDVFRETCGQDSKLYFSGVKTYHELGIVNDASVFLVQSEMGVSGPGSSLQTVRDGIKALSPSSVIMVGIAFGVDPHWQHIGDILVSKQLHGHGHQRLGTAHDGTPEVTSRGDRVTSSIKLLDRCRSASFKWRKLPPQERKAQRKQRRAEVHFGTILSGEKLIDNIELRDQLLMLEPDAIGGEMEGIGLYSAAQSEKVDWILVKAICDWADGNKAGDKASRIMTQMGDKATKKTSNKDRNQKLAARNAAEYVVYVLSTTKFV